ncbi:serine/threonine-protein kinase [Thalassoglobus polymorphus]|uniref:Serine/threonine-protein kinase PknB n=1 Tax=Thalassoglobus polymorphus TaxID=2527994 RepID=A0A517QIK0_9PLAN|nr:serine/threonine-protein kinase [Thalassoglobus polymorphus]QDT31451.1 Serine/threonine-protein kinase PknB [Thalassoglobus polymorphus]
MSEQVAACPQCGAELPADAVSGLCPKCLLQLGFDSVPNPGTETGPYHPTFIAPTAEQLSPYFPDFEILELIGHGGMGVVYKAKQKELDRLVALKILRPDIEKDPSFAERFQREARTLAQLNHPNIITIHNFGRKDDLYFLVMEYVDGTNLRQLERSAQLKPAEALMIVPKICEALQYAHDRGVVHRDIKPENILITQEGWVKIADFGLAKLSGVPDQVSLTGTWQIMGTPHYMAPEQFEHPTEVDHRADIFSLGVVIYEMLTGELPLGRFPRPSEKTAGDKRLDDVVERTLHKEPASRYQQVSEVKTAVEGISSSPEQQQGADSSRKTYGSYLYEKLTGQQLKATSSRADSPEESREKRLKSLHNGTVYIFLLCTINLLGALILLPFPGVNLLFIFGLVSGSALYVLKHLILRRQNLQLAQWLTVVASLPLSMLCVANWIVLFLFARLDTLWKPEIESEFEEVPWNETDAARQCSSIWSWVKSFWGSVVSLFMKLWNEKSRILDGVVWLFRSLLRKFQAILPLFLGLAIWSAMWGSAAFFVEEYWIERYAPATYHIRDTTAGTLVPHSGAYEGIQVTVSESGTTYGKKLPLKKSPRSGMRLQLIPHPSSKRQRHLTHEFYLDSSIAPPNNRVGIWRENELLSPEFLKKWMAEAGIDVQDPMVQSEIEHLDQQVHLLLETGGIERDRNHEVTFPSVDTFFDEQYFTATDKGYVSHSVSTDREVQRTLQSAFVITWLLGSVSLLVIFIAYWMTPQSDEQFEMRSPGLLKWCSRGLIAYSLFGFLSLLSVDWLLFRSGWDLNFLPDFSHIDDPVRFAFEGALLACLIVTLLAGLTILRQSHLLSSKRLAIVAAMIVMIIPPWNLLAFPLGYATFFLIKTAVPKQ